jgi:hypothetical protein
VGAAVVILRDNRMVGRSIEWELLYIADLFGGFQSGVYDSDGIIWAF